MRHHPAALKHRPAIHAKPHHAHEHTDEALIGKIAAGNRLAMQVLFLRHQARVFRFVLRLGCERALAEDLTSEVFLTVWQQAHRFEARSAVTTWLLAIARYQALTAIRHDGYIDADAQIPEMSDPADDPEAHLATTDRGRILRECLTRLSREHREVIDLAYYHEKSVQEIAAIIGVPEGTVKTRMFHARRRLSELLRAQGVDSALP